MKACVMTNCILYSSTKAIYNTVIIIRAFGPPRPAQVLRSIQLPLSVSGIKCQDLLTYL